MKFLYMKIKVFVRHSLIRKKDEKEGSQWVFSIKNDQERLNSSLRLKLQPYEPEYKS